MRRIKTYKPDKNVKKNAGIYQRNIYKENICKKVIYMKSICNKNTSKDIRY